MGIRVRAPARTTIIRLRQPWAFRTTDYWLTCDFMVAIGGVR